MGEPLALPFSDVRLRDLGGRLAIPEWREVDWSLCDACSGTHVGPADDELLMYDGEPLVCPDCGLVCSCGVEEEDGNVFAHASDAHSRLTDIALAGLRRLLGWRRSEWWNEREGDG